jgi:hypothetical protein
MVGTLSIPVLRVRVCDGRLPTRYPHTHYTPARIEHAPTHTHSMYCTISLLSPTMVPSVRVVTLLDGYTGSPGVETLCMQWHAHGAADATASPLPPISVTPLNARMFPSMSCLPSPSSPARHAMTLGRFRSLVW